MTGDDLLSALSADLGRVFTGEVRVHEPMSRHTTIGIGGPADIFATARTLDDLQALFEFCRKRSLPVTPLGDGSNVLMSDLGVRGVVLRLSGDFDMISVRDGVLTAGAGVRLSRAITQAASDGLAGLEVVYGVPGSVGGGVVMNAGTRHGWLSDALLEVRVVDPDGHSAWMPKEEIGMSYRSSALQSCEPPLVVAAVRFGLRSEAPEAIRHRIHSMAEARKLTQPLNCRSCGCMFRNPQGDSAGRLIDAAGLKGLRVGGASVSDVHANFLVSDGTASAADVMTLAARVRAGVAEKSGVELQFEVKFLGEWPDEQP